MPIEEFYSWVAYFQFTHEEQEKAAKKARKK